MQGIKPLPLSCSLFPHWLNISGPCPWQYRANSAGVCVSAASGAVDGVASPCAILSATKTLSLCQCCLVTFRFPGDGNPLLSWGGLGGEGEQHHLPPQLIGNLRDAWKDSVGKVPRKGHLNYEVITAPAR